MTIDLSAVLDAVPEAVVARFRSARRVLVVSHENPDADTLGAGLGVVRLVESFGAAADPVCTDPVPALYDFLPGVDRFRTDPDPAAAYDLAVIVDCGSLDRVGAVGTRHAELFASLPRVVIDHHASNDAAGEADWIDPRAAATCEMVALLAARLGIGPGLDDGALAADLMAGIVMDTATFAHPNATPRTLLVSAWLIEAGAPLSDISRRLYRSKPEAQLRLFGRQDSASKTVADAIARESGGNPFFVQVLVQCLTAETAIGDRLSLIEDVRRCEELPGRIDGRDHLAIGHAGTFHLRAQFHQPKTPTRRQDGLQLQIGIGPVDLNDMHRPRTLRNFLMPIGKALHLFGRGRLGRAERRGQTSHHDESNDSHLRT